MGWLSSCLAPFSPQPTPPDALLAMGCIPAASYLSLKPSQVAGMGRSSSLVTMAPRPAEASCHPALGHAPSRWHGLGNPLPPHKSTAGGFYCRNVKRK